MLISYSNRRALVALAAASVVVISTNAFAVSGNWVGATDAWQLDSNWSATPFPAAGDTATFNAASANTTIDVGTGLVVGAIVFDTAAVPAYTIGTGGAGVQTFGFGDTGAAVTLNATVLANQTINANLVLGTAAASTTTFTNSATAASGVALNFGGSITGGTDGVAGIKTLNTAGTGAINLLGTIDKGGASLIRVANTGAGNTTLSGGGAMVFDTLRSTGNGTITVNNATANITVASNSTYGASSSTSGKFVLTNGTVAFNGGIGSTTSGGAPGGNDGMGFIVNGGTFSAASVALGRSQNTGSSTTFFTAPLNLGTSGFQVNGGTATVTGAVRIAGSNSSATGQVSGSGSLTVGGEFAIGETTTRTNLFQVTGGSLTVNDTVGGGIVVGKGTAAATAAGQLLLTGGTTTTEKVTFGLSGGLAGSQGRLTINGGSLYVGSGGIALAATNAYTSTIQLTSGTLGAKADWTSSVPMALNGAGSAFTIRAADAANTTGYNITLAGDLSGAGGFTKTGGGTLTLSGATGYAGPTVINAGTLAVGGASNQTIAGQITNSGGTFSKVNGNTLSLTGSGSSLGTLNVAAGTLVVTGSTATAGATTVADGATLNPKFTVAGSSPLTLGSNSLTLGNSTLAVDFSNLNPTAAAISLPTGTLTLNGTVTPTVANTSFLSNGPHVLIDYGTLAGLGSFNTTPISLGARSTGTISNDAANTAIVLNVASEAAVWTGVNGSSWSEFAPNSPTSATPNFALKSSHTAADFWTTDTAEFNDTYQIGASVLPVTQTTVNIVGGAVNGAGVAPTAVIFNNSAVNYTLTGASITAGTLLKGGTGTLTIANANTYAGGTTINGGTVSIANDAALGAAAGAVNLGAGTLQVTQDVASARPITVGAANSTLSVDATKTVTHTGAISDGALAGTLVKAGPGTLALGGTNTSTGGTNLSAGVVQLNSATGLGTVGNIAFTGGSLQYGTGVTTDLSARIKNSTAAITIDTNGQTVTYAGAIDNTNTAGLVKNGAGVLNAFGPLGYTGDTFVNAGELGVRAGGSVGGAIRMADGTTLRMLANGGTSLFLGNALYAPSGGNATIESSALGNGYGGDVFGDSTSRLTIGANVSFSSSNQSAALAQLANFNGTVDVTAIGTLRFSGSNDFSNGGANATLNVQSGGFVTTRQRGTITFAGITGGGTLTGTSGLVTYVIGGTSTSSTFDGVISAGGGVGLTKVGTGNLRLTNANTYTGTTTVAAGTLTTVYSDGGPSASSPLLTGAGGVDLTGGRLVLDHSASTSPITAVRALLAAGQPSNFATGQIRATTFAATPSRGIGYAELGGGLLAVQSTFYGDATLDGLVNVADLGALATNYGATDAVWAQGDFNYDAAVSVADLGLLATYYGSGTSLTAADAAAQFRLDLASVAASNPEFAAAMGIVPEPTTLAAVGLAALAFGRRRRRAV